jgi:hypothetical protein
MKSLILVCSVLLMFPTSIFSQEKKLSLELTLENRAIVLTIDVNKGLLVLLDKDSLSMNKEYRVLLAEVDIYSKVARDEVLHEYSGTIELDSFNFPIAEFEKNECINITQLKLQNKKTKKNSLFFNLSLDLELKRKERLDVK